VNAGILKSPWVWLIVGLAVSLLLMKVFPGSFFLFLPFLGFIPFGFRSKTSSATNSNAQRVPAVSVTDEEQRNVSVISRLVTRYNTQDANGVAACFAPDSKEYAHPGEFLREGPQAIADNYNKLFADFPQNRADVLHRSAFTDKVIDHERVWRSPTHEPFDVIVIYTLKNGAIVRTDYVK
jgi:hypothetical protein